MTKKALTISIIIPVYNEADYLDDCLRSIAAQTVAPSEVIVVDNNSTDGSVKIAQKYQFVRVIHEKQQGIRAAHTAGMNAAQSTILARIDADTRLPADWIARVQGFYNDPAHAEQALTGGCYFYNIRQPEIAEWITSQIVFRMNRVMAGHYVLWGSNMALPRKLWRAVRHDLCQRDDIHEDLDLAIHLHQNGYQINYQSTLLARARLARTIEDHGQLWAFTMMWPRTLRVHHNRNWVFSYVGGVTLYVLQIVPRSAELIARLFGYKPLTARRSK